MGRAKRAHPARVPGNSASDGGGRDRRDGTTWEADDEGAINDGDDIAWLDEVEHWHHAHHIVERANGVPVPALVFHLPGTTAGYALLGEAKPTTSKKVKAKKKAKKTTRRAHGEDSIYESGGRWWVEIQLGIVRNGDQAKRRVKKFSAKTQAEALARRNEYRKRLNAGTLPSDEKMTVKDYVHHWLDNVVKANPESYRARTAAEYERYMTVDVLPRIGHMKLAKLRSVDIEQLVAALRKRPSARGGMLSEKSCWNVVVCLRACLETAKKSKLVAHNPVVDANNLPKPARSQAEAIEPQDIAKLMPLARKNPLFLAFVLLASLGLRRGEVFGLKDVDLTSSGVLRVRRQIVRLKGKGLVEAPPKTESGSRDITLPAEILDELKEHSKRQKVRRLKAGAKWKAAGYLFTTKGGGPIDPRNFYRLFQTWLQRAGLPSMPVHRLRHTAASMMITQNLHAKAIQKTLGHSDFGTTMDIYGHMLDGHGAKVAASIGASYREFLGENLSVVEAPSATAPPTASPSPGRAAAKIARASSLLRAVP